MNKLKVTLVDDAKEFWKWSSVRWHFIVGALVLLVGHLQELLYYAPGVLQYVQDNWQALLPTLQHYFPNATQADWITAANGVGLLLRITQIQRHGPPNGPMGPGGFGQ